MYEDLNGLIVLTDETKLSNPDFLNEALEAIKMTKSRFSLAQARIVYEVRHRELWKDWPTKNFDSFEDWGAEVLERKRAMVYGLARVYEVFVVENNVELSRLSNIEFSKLHAASAHVDDKNVDEIMTICEQNTLYDVQKILRQRVALNDTDATPKKVKFTFDVTDLQGETVRDALNIAEELVNSPVPGKMLEYICADFLCGAGLESRETHLQRCINALEIAFNVKLALVDADVPVVEGKVSTKPLPPSDDEASSDWYDYDPAEAESD